MGRFRNKCSFGFLHFLRAPTLAQEESDRAQGPFLCLSVATYGSLRSEQDQLHKTQKGPLSIQVPITHFIFQKFGLPISLSELAVGQLRV